MNQGDLFAAQVRRSREGYARVQAIDASLAWWEYHDELAKRLRRGDIEKHRAVDLLREMYMRQMRRFFRSLEEAERRQEWARRIWEEDGGLWAAFTRTLAALYPSPCRCSVCIRPIATSASAGPAAST